MIMNMNATSTLHSFPDEKGLSCREESDTKTMTVLVTVKVSVMLLEEKGFLRKEQSGTKDWHHESMKRQEKSPFEKVPC